MASNWPEPKFEDHSQAWCRDVEKCLCMCRECMNSWGACICALCENEECLHD